MPSSSISAESLSGPWSHRMLHVRGQRLHVAECGTNADPLVLMIHGSTSGWFEWRGVLSLLHDAPVHAVAVSLRGYAPSDRTPKGYSPITAADDLSGLIRALGHKSAVVVGQGFGSWVAWTLHARHPKVVDHLVTRGSIHPAVWFARLRKPWSSSFHTSVVSSVKYSWSALPSRMQHTLRGRASREDHLIDRMVSSAMADTGTVEVGHGQEARRVAFVDTQMGKETAILLRESLAGGALRPALEHVEWCVHPWLRTRMKWLRTIRQAPCPPTTLLVGEVDCKSPMELAQATAELLNSAYGRDAAAHVVEVPFAGHYLPVEAADAVAARILAAL